MVQAFCRRPLTAEARVRSRVIPGLYCGGQSGAGKSVVSAEVLLSECHYVVKRHPKPKPTADSCRHVPDSHNTTCSTWSACIYSKRLKSALRASLLDKNEIAGSTKGGSDVIGQFGWHVGLHVCGSRSVWVVLWSYCVEFSKASDWPTLEGVCCLLEGTQCHRELFLPDCHAVRPSTEAVCSSLCLELPCPVHTDPLLSLPYSRSPSDLRLCLVQWSLCCRQYVT